MDALTKVLVNLYEESEKPEDALAQVFPFYTNNVLILTYCFNRYLRNKLATQSGCETLETVKAQLEEANAKIAALENENMALKSGDVKETSEEVGEPVPEVDEPLDEVTGSVTEATSEAPAPPPE